MKRKLLQVIFSVIAILLCVTSLSGTAILPVQADGAKLAFDYGDGQVAANESISASELFALALGSAPVGAEKAYLEELSDIRLFYNTAIPSENISTNYHRESGSLDVSVQSYAYTAKNGVTVEWIPQSATIEGQTKTLDPSYSCHFENLSQLATGDFQMEVVFSTVIQLPGNALSLLANDAYTAGVAALESLNVYAEEYRAWEAARDRYLAYTAYLEAVQNFEDYQAALKIYEAENIVYQQYCRDYEQYRVTLLLYENWRQYYAYQKFLEEGVERYRLYLEYRSQVDKVLAKLEILETLFVSDSHNWQLYASLMGGTVTEVVARKDELVAAGCNAKDINAAGEATEELRTLMKEYAKLRGAEYSSKHDKTAALYAFYSQNYAALRAGYTKLYGALISLYDNSLVVSKLDLEGKLAHFQQFVGQLYYVATVLDDTVKTSDSWTISKKSLTDVVEECHRVTDTNTASPDGVPMPTAEVAEVKPVDPIEEPTAPDPVVKPTAPDEVSEPKKPDEVSDPSLSAIPPVAVDPGAAPEAPGLSPCLVQLAEEVGSGKLTKRTVAEEGKTLTLTTTCTRLVSIDNKKVVTFYDADRKTVLYQTTLEYGSPITYRGPDIQNKQDNQYYYSFYRWELADHTPAELVANSDLSLYARYWQRDRFYTVTWILDGVRYTEQYVWGATPISPFPNEKPESEGYTYRFSGWRSDSFSEMGIFDVCGDVTYVASFEPIPKTFTVTWVFSFADGNDAVFEEEYKYLDYPRCSGNTEYADTSYRYTCKGWQENLQSVTTDTVYHAKLDRVPLAVADNGAVLDVVHTENELRVNCTADRVDMREAALSARAAGKKLVLAWDDFTVTVLEDALEALVNSNCRKIGVVRQNDSNIGRTYTLAYYNSLNYPIEPAFEILLQINLQGGKQISLYVLQNEEWVSVGDDEIRHTGALTYRAVDVHSINVSSSSNCDLSQIPVSAEVGSIIDLRVTCKFGYEVSAATVRLADGRTLEVTDLCFVMPNSAVSVDLTVTRIVYHVSFVVDGTVIFEKEYFLGEQIELPQAPTKASDGAYDYTFGGWSREVTVAYGSERTMVIEAIFIATEIPVKDPYKSLHNNNLFLTVILPCFLGLVAVAVGVLIFFKRRKTCASATQITCLREDVTVVDAPLQNGQGAIHAENDQTDES